MTTTATESRDQLLTQPAALAATLAGLAALGQATYHLVTPGPPGATFGSFGDWLRDGLFLVYLLASAAAVVLAHRRGLAPRRAAVLVGVGYVAIAAGVAISLALQRDPDWFFPLLGGPGNLLALAGFVAWGVWAFRRRILPRWAAVWCAVGGATAVLGAELGTSAVIGAFWLWIALSRSGLRAQGS